MNSKDKIKKRHKAIKELIERHEIEDQRTLIKLMYQQYKIDTNQSIVSRDLHALGISKRVLKGKTVYELPAKDASKEILQLAVVSVEHNESIIVIYTLPGLADFIGDYLDMCKHPDILGTIAGENVVFVSPRSTHDIKHVFKEVCMLILFKQEIGLKEKPHEPA